MVVVKCCSGCGVAKSLDDFHRNRTRPDGRTSQCKECQSARDRRYREENRDKVRERRSRYYEENRDKAIEYSRRYYEENRDDALERKRQYREENRDKVLDRQRRHYEENRDKVLECQRRYYEENRDKVRERHRRYNAENREYMNRLTSRHASRSRSVTKSAATKRGPWSEAEVAILMADDGRTIVAKALELGRTYHSCRYKREHLRRTGVTN